MRDRMVRGEGTHVNPAPRSWDARGLTLIQHLEQWEARGLT